MTYEQLKLDNQLCFPFYAVSRLITRAYQDDLDTPVPADSKKTMIDGFHAATVPQGIKDQDGAKNNDQHA